MDRNLLAVAAVVQQAGAGPCGGPMVGTSARLHGIYGQFSLDLLLSAADDAIVIKLGKKLAMFARWAARDRHGTAPSLEHWARPSYGVDTEGALAAWARRDKKVAYIGGAPNVWFADAEGMAFIEAAVDQGVGVLREEACGAAADDGDDGQGGGAQSGGRSE